MIESESRRVFFRPSGTGASLHLTQGLRPGLNYSALRAAIVID